MTERRQHFAIHPRRRDTETQERARRAFLSGVIVVQPQDEPTPGAGDDSDGLSADARNVLFKIVQEPGVFTMNIFSDLGLSGAQGKAAIDELLGQGLVRQHRIPRVGRGAQYKTLEPLPAADPILHKAGLPRPLLKIKGSWIHNIFGLFVAKWAISQGGRGVVYEKTLGDKAFDLVFQDADANLVGVEICQSGSPQRTAEQILRGLDNPGVKAMAVFADRASLNKTSKELEKHDASALASGRLDLILIGEIIQSLQKERS